MAVGFGSVSHEELYNVVCGAASQDPTQVQASSKRLKELLDSPGALDILHQIAAQRAAPLQVRQQSIIQFRNAINNNWRNRRLLSDEQRTEIKTRCLAFLDEPDDIISQYNTLVVRKIFRQDTPKNWPLLVPQTMGTLSAHIEARFVKGDTSISILPIRRSLQVLDGILKEYTAVRTPAMVAIAAKLVEDMRETLRNYYSLISATFTSTLSPSTLTDPRIAENILLAHLVFKCVVNIGVWVWRESQLHDPYKHLQPWIRELFQNSAIQLQTLSELRINLVLALPSSPADPVTSYCIDRLTRHVRLFGKFFRRMQQLSTTHFALQPVCANLVLYYWSKVVQATNGPPEHISDSNTAVFPVRFILQGMVLFKESLGQWAPVRKNGVESERVLSKEFVEGAVRLLVTRFIPLNPGDLEAWMADPEEWMNGEANEQWEYELRPCGERVLMTLANQYHQYVTPLLEATFKELGGQHAVDLPSIVQKEALYCAIGRCANRLANVIPFDQWLEQTLTSEAQDPNPNYPIIKRRIAWLIGKWVSEEHASPTNPRIWEVLVYLLRDRGPGTDGVVRLTASTALQQCADALKFDANVFAPFLPTAVTELVRLIAETETFESKARVIHTLNVVISVTHERIIPFMGIIVEPFPQLWTAAGEDYACKGTMLSTIVMLVEAAKEKSASLTALVVPLVTDSLTGLASLALDEDALSLWRIAVRNATTMDDIDGAAGLHTLLPLLVRLLTDNMDLLGRLVDIAESYILLDPNRLLQICAVELFSAFKSAIGNKPPDLHVHDIAVALDHLFQLANSSLWAEALHTSGLFAVFVRTLMEEKASVTILTGYIYVMARIAVTDRQALLNLMTATALSQNIPEKDMWEGVLDQWWTRFDNMSESRHRKLAVMGITNLVATGRPEVLERLPFAICNMWLDVFGEIKESLRDDIDGKPSTLKLYWEQVPETFWNNSEDTVEYTRRTAYFENDIVRTTKLTTYIAAKISEAEAQCGGANAFQQMYLAKADPLVLKQIQAELAA